MEISDRRELDQLIAYSKSFRKEEIVDIYGHQSPRDQQQTSLIFDLPMIEEESTNIIENVDLTEEQLKEQIRQFLFQNLDEQPPPKQQQEVQEQSVQVEEQKQQIPEEQSSPNNLKENRSETTDVFRSFSRVSEEYLAELDKGNNRKSLFTERVKKNSVVVSQSQNNGGRPIKPKFVNIKIMRNTTVLEAIKIAMETYKMDPNLDNALLRSNTTDAYELRLLDDDDGCKADMTFGAIDKSKLILSTQSDCFAIIENANYKPPVQQKESEINSTFERLSGNKVLIQIEIKDDKEDRMETKLLFDKDQCVKDIFETVNRKNKRINVKDYIAKVKFQNDEDFVELDLKVPVHMIAEKKIILTKKVWADQAPIKKTHQQTIPNMRQQSLQGEDEEFEAPLNPIQAYKYEKFTVVKINERGKRQDRVLGIDQFRIYNMNKKENLNIFEKILSNKETGTKFPERLIEDIVDIKAAGQYLQIIFKQEGLNVSIKKNSLAIEKKEKFKELKFDTLDIKMAKKIEKKLNFIRNASKSRAFSQKFD